ncbi:MAG: hypothetical protein GAK29_03173 [Acinetobacter bereziniae]|uniref:Uncharacterized protein n=1 Tax=Acinetobacter bereziniae TaxID=106648 RepID=A0A833PDP8_ACIBZ|nr:MAG: hypothetical protein GAK29_03173 [Acinetobacter bereziniae]
MIYAEHIPLTITDLTEDESANQQFEQLIQARNQIEKHQEQFDLLKHQLQAKMQQAERATFLTGSVTWKKSKDSVSLDSKALLKSHPEYINQFPPAKHGTRRFQMYAMVDKSDFIHKHHENTNKQAYISPCPQHGLFYVYLI